MTPTLTSTLLVSIRKGLFEAAPAGGSYAVTRGHFIGDNVTLALTDPRDAPEVFWVQHHNGIFVSTDDMATWREITEAGPSVFGFPVVVDPADPRTAWFVPSTKDERRCPTDGKVVVTRTRDGGATFDVLRTGLPQVHAYDLVYRHAFARAPEGARVFGSTTGNVFASADGGDAWQVVANHLPPVHAVTFAVTS